jgi:hypothetical protein
MDREGHTTTAGTPPAKQLGRVGLWTSKLDLQPADQLRTVLTELEGQAGVRCGPGRSSAARR